MEETKILPDFLFADTSGEIADRFSLIKCQNNLVIVSIHNTLNIFDIKKGTCNTTLCDQKPARITAFNIYEDGSVFCIGYESGVIKIFEDGKKTKQFRPHSKRVTDIYIHENSMISSSADGTLIRYDMFDEEVKTYYKNTKGAIYNFKVVNNFMAANSGDNVIRYWDIAGEMCVGIVPCDNEILDFVYLKGFFVVFYCNGESFVYDQKTQTRKKFNVFKKIRRIKMNGQHLFVLAKGKLLVYRISLKNDEETSNNPLEIEKQSLKNERIGKDEETSNNPLEIEKQIKDFNINPELVLQSIGSHKVDQNYHTFDVVNESEVVFVSQRNKIVFLNLVNNLEFKISYHETEIFEILFCSKKVLTFSEEKYILWKIVNDKIEKMHSCDLDFKATNACLLGSTILLSSSDSIYFYDMKNNNLLNRIDISNKTLHLNKNTLFVGLGSELAIYLVDPTTLDLELIKKVRFHDEITCINSSGSQMYYGISFLDNTLQIFDFLTHDNTNSLYGHSLPIRYFTFSPSSDTILTCGTDKLLKLWGTEFGECRKSFLGDALNVCYLTKHAFIFCDDKIKYFKKHVCIRQYKGYNHRIIRYSDQMLVVALKYGFKYYKTGLYEIDERYDDSDEVEDEILREQKITDYKLYERLIIELNKIEMEQKNDLFDLYQILRFINLAEIDKFIYFLTECHVRIILRSLKEYYRFFPINAMRIFINIGRIYSYLCRNDKEVYGLFKVLRKTMEEMSERIGTNMMEITLV